MRKILIIVLIFLLTGCNEKQIKNYDHLDGEGDHYFIVRDCECNDGGEDEYCDMRYILNLYYDTFDNINEAIDRGESLIGKEIEGYTIDKYAVFAICNRKNDIVKYGLGILDGDTEIQGEINLENLEKMN
ncbi:hypothetical protein [Anaerorhabdus furcosa]|uniref:Uncharacterized protein n=1 Tax=Anaerorhabdus furcosa TaxID=118967 RepID=A0A1T4JVA9_9FIRM|nr:hypothetical protein [Anaerorhabdus furcosa]SJZ34083.1 hypothetical protein SAMN02745191_0107 [Anaerorhabdus furcosa]